jgi:hypothetical protein
LRSFGVDQTWGGGLHAGWETDLSESPLLGCARLKTKHDGPLFRQVLLAGIDIGTWHIVSRGGGWSGVLAGWLGAPIAGSLQRGTKSVSDDGDKRLEQKRRGW